MSKENGNRSDQDESPWKPTVYDWLESAQAAVDLLLPENFTQLSRDRQIDVLKATGVDPNSPTALDEAMSRANEQLTRMFRYLKGF